MIMEKYRQCFKCKEGVVTIRRTLTSLWEKCELCDYLRDDDITDNMVEDQLEKKYRDEYEEQKSVHNEEL